jgi:hypothetical protein
VQLGQQFRRIDHEYVGVLAADDLLDAPERTVGRPADALADRRFRS